MDKVFSTRRLCYGRNPSIRTLVSDFRPLGASRVFSFTAGAAT